MVLVPQLVEDIYSGSNGSLPSDLTTVNNTLFFTADDGINGFELWKSDGTDAGTILVKTIGSSSSGSSPRQLIALNDALFFTATGANGTELWKSDGTEAGTVLVKDINLGSNGSSPSSLIVFNGNLLFSANNGNKGVELWRSDGTGAGTVLLKDIRNGQVASSPKHLTQIGNQVFFSADGGGGRALWVTDGTDTGTTKVADINPFVDDQSKMVEFDGKLFFTANGGTGRELWVSDGTDAGTQLFKEINPNGDSQPRHLTVFNGSLFFTAKNKAEGRELWISDGTPEGTHQFTDIRPGKGNASPRYLTEFNGKLYFRANDGVHGNELWVSDGTPEGTQLFKDIQSGRGKSDPRDLVMVGDTLYFSATTGAKGYELWQTDGTADGTVRVTDLHPGSSGSSPLELIGVGNNLFFTADDGTSGRELWVLGDEPLTPVNAGNSDTGNTSPVPPAPPAPPANTTPMAGNDGGESFTTTEDAALTTGNVLTNDSDSENDTLTITDVDIDGTNGLVINNGDGTFNYDPNGQFEALTAGETAIDQFSYTVSDGNGGQDTAIVTITITGENEAISAEPIPPTPILPENLDPTATDDGGIGFTTDEDTAFTTSNVLTNDVDDADDIDDTLTVIDVITTDTVGLVTHNNDGTFSYSPNGQFESLSFGETAVDRFSYIITDGNGGQDTATVTITITGMDDITDDEDNVTNEPMDGPLEESLAYPSVSDMVFFSNHKSGTVGELAFTNQDILQFDGTETSIFFDGSNVLPTKGVINAFDVISPTEILMSFANPFKLDGLGQVDDSDVVKFTATSFGEGTTTGQFELYIDGSDLGLDQTSEDIDALTQLPNGDLLFSTTGDTTLTNCALCVGKDILRLSASSFGADTVGSISLYMDGSAVALTQGGENVDAVSLDGSDILLSTTGNLRVPGFAAQDEDVAIFTPTSMGPITSGAFSGIFFDGSQSGVMGDISGFDVNAAQL